MSRRLPLQYLPLDKVQRGTARTAETLTFARALENADWTGFVRGESVSACRSEFVIAEAPTQGLRKVDQSTTISILQLGGA